MEWTRSLTLPLASVRCTQCKGFGLLSDTLPCKCVFRAVFRACIDRFRECVEADRHGSQARKVQNTWCRIPEEFIADLYLMSQRTLTPTEWRIFKFHYLLGADWKLCCRRLKMDKGSFWHAVYRIEAKLGRVYAETQPYGLFPLDEYFGGTVRPEGVTATVPEIEQFTPVQPPLAQEAA